MNITEIIRNRRATPPRILLRNTVPKATIEKLLQNANWAPNHKKTEPWRFKVYSGNAKVELAKKFGELLRKHQSEGYELAMEKISKFENTVQNVPVAIAIIVQKDPAKRLPEWEEVAAVSMAVQNMWLTATEMGLGAFWASPAFINLFDEILGLDEGQELLGFFYVGEVMMDYPSPGRGEINTKVEWFD